MQIHLHSVLLCEEAYSIRKSYVAILCGSVSTNV